MTESEAEPARDTEMEDATDVKPLSPPKGADDSEESKSNQGISPSKDDGKEGDNQTPALSEKT